VIENERNKPCMARCLLRGKRPWVRGGIFSTRRTPHYNSRVMEW